MTLLEALRVVLREEHLADTVYSVKSRAGEMGDGFTGNLWDHPRVGRFSEAVDTLEVELKRLEVETDRDDPSTCRHQVTTNRRVDGVWTCTSCGDDVKFVEHKGWQPVERHAA